MSLAFEPEALGPFGFADAPARSGEEADDGACPLAAVATKSAERVVATPSRARRAPGRNRQSTKTSRRARGTSVWKTRNEGRRDQIIARTRHHPERDPDRSPHPT